MTLDTLREMAERELTEDELNEARSTVRRYLRNYENRLEKGLKTHVTSEEHGRNFSPTYRENMVESFRLYLEAGPGDGFRDAILAIGDDNVEPLEVYLED